MKIDEWQLLGFAKELLKELSQYKLVVKTDQSSEYNTTYEIKKIS
jgi:hypothetical protein